MIANKIGIAVTVRAHEEIIIRFIDYHLSKDIDEIYIFFDDPSFNQNINLSSMKYFSFLASFGKLAYLDLSNKPL